MLNVKFGRWKNITPQAADIALGYYGRTSAPVDPEVQKLCAEKMGKEPITCRPADLIKPGMEDLRRKLAEKGLPHGRRTLRHLRHVPAAGGRLLQKAGT